jgi:hypothetical protein
LKGGGLRRPFLFGNRVDSQPVNFPRATLGGMKQRKITTRLECSECGATTDAACDCGAPYIPARTRAAKAVAIHPFKSDRELARECGVGRTTIQRARKSGGPHGPPERVGKDGKKYRPRVGISADEGQRQFTALVLRLLLMIQGQEPQRYTMTRVSPDDLRSVGRFVSKVAAAKVAGPVGKKAAAG